MCEVLVSHFNRLCISKHFQLTQDEQESNRLHRVTMLQHISCEVSTGSNCYKGDMRKKYFRSSLGHWYKLLVLLLHLIKNKDLRTVKCSHKNFAIKSLSSVSRQLILSVKFDLINSLHFYYMYV